MVKWTLFALVSLAWIGGCWFFANMAALTNVDHDASWAQRQCASRQVEAARAQGRVLSQHDAEMSAECMEIYNATLRERSAPTLRKGLMIGVLPVLAIGLLMFWLTVVRPRSG